MPAKSPKISSPGGAKVKFMVPDGCREQALIESAGKDNLDDRTYVTFGGLPPSQLQGRGKEFYENYKKKYNAEPEAYAVYGYEAARVVLEGIKRAGKKGPRRDHRCHRQSARFRRRPRQMVLRPERRHLP